MRLFSWKVFNSWNMKIEYSISKTFSLSKIKKIFAHSDCPISELDSEIIDCISDSFWDQFDNIISYHASKPVVPKEIHNSGLVPLNIEHQIKIFKEIFPYDVYKITEEDIEYSLKKIGTEVRNGFLYTVLDDRTFEGLGSGHYLVHGSEFILGLTVNLPSHINSIVMTDVLLNRGNSTIFRIAVPINKVALNERIYLINDILTEWWYMINHTDTDTGIIDYSFCLKESIEPEFIIDHYHPKSVINPHSRMYGPKIYIPDIKCSMCNKIN